MDFRRSSVFGIHKTRPKILPFVKVTNKNDLPCVCAVSFTVCSLLGPFRSQLEYHDLNESVGRLWAFQHQTLFANGTVLADELLPKF